METSQKLTSEMTQSIVSDLKEQLGDSKSLHDITPEMMADAGDLAKPEEPPQTDEE